MSGCVEAQSFPEKPVRIIVGLAPGGGVDTTGRLLAQKLSEQLGQHFIVDNRPSAGSLVAIDLVKQASADGYTLFYTSPEFATGPSLRKTISYDPLRDFAPVSHVLSNQYMLAVRSNLPVRTVKELIAYSKSQPQPLTYASTGIGGVNHLAGEMFKQMAGILLTHVPYKGAGPAIAALLSGEIHTQFSSITGILPHARAGRVRALAVTGIKRTPSAPDVPTVMESGLPAFSVTGWYGLLAPAKTPTAVLDKLNSVVNRALPPLAERLRDLGNEEAGGTRAAFAAFLATEVTRWAAVVQAAGVTAE